MKKKYIFFAPLLLIFLYSCDNKNARVISIDVRNVQQISEFKDDFRIISLDTLQLALLGEVRSIMFLDDKIAIYTANRLSLFDNFGNYLRDIGQRGQANNEFVNLNSVFYRNNAFGLFDGGTQRILKFDADGAFIDSKNFDPSSEYSVNRVVPFLDGYTALLRYMGSFIETPTFGRFNKNLVLIETAGKNRISGLSLFQTFSSYQDDLLYWNMLDYTIYSIDKNFVVQDKYFIDFGRHSIPNRIIRSNNAERIMEYVQRNAANVVVAIQNVVEQESFLSFIFNVGEDLYLAIFNKENNNTKIHHLKLSEDFVFYPFMTIHNGYYVLSGVDMQNPYSNLEIIFIKQNLLQ